MTAALLLLAGLVGSPVPPEAWARLPEHPRLFATAADWQAVRTRVAADPVAAKLAALVQSRADWLLAKPPVTYGKRDRGTMSGSMLEPAREVQARVFALAMAARLTGEQRYVDRAVVELRELAALESWNPAVFLDTAEATLAAAVGLDWLSDRLAPEDRDLIAAAIAEKGLRASIDANPTWLGWVKGTNNWNQVCHAAMVAGAVAIADREPELAQQVVQRAVDELKSSAKAYDPDGAYPEGPMYWSYGTSFHVMLVAALETALGDDFGTADYPGLLATADYITQVTGPSGQTFNYSDSTTSRHVEPCLFWFARRRGQPSLMQYELADLEQRPADKLSGMQRFFPLALLWWDPAVQAKASPPSPLSCKADGVAPVAVHRSAWDDPQATWLAIKAGRAHHSHGHVDAGSFVLEADGVRWAVDPGMQGYDSLYKAGLSSELWKFGQDSRRWDVFRIGPEGHNILRFNGAPPLVDGRAEIVRFDDGGSPFTILDVGQVYADQVTAAQRGFRLLADRRVVIQDEWTTGQQPVEVAWQWLTTATVELGDGQVTLQQQGQTLTLRVVEPAGVAWDVVETAALQQEWDAPNKGLRRLVGQVKTAAGSTGRLVIVAEPGSVDGAQPSPGAPLSDW